MPEKTITTELLVGDTSNIFEDDAEKETMIRVENVSMVFNMANEQLNSLKEYTVALLKGKLFFEAFTALDNVSFEVKRGDVYGLMGTNGSGKSTMLKIIAGVMNPTKGSCWVKGKIAPLIELGAGFDMELSARENVYLNGALLGYSKQFIDQNFDAIVSFAEIEKFLDMPLKNYSSGMVARIAFAIATIIVPDVLIVDEVLSVGDFMFQKKCEDRIKELITQHGVTVLIVSHSTEQIERLCNKAIWIEKGHTRMVGDATKVCHSYRALAGRTGNPESEKLIYDTLESGLELEDNSWNTTIAGESPLDTSVELCRAAWANKSFDNLVLACSNTHVNSVIACGLAGALEAPLVATEKNRLTAEIRHFIQDYKPSRIYLSDCGRCFSQSVIDSLTSFDWKPEVIFIGKDRHPIVFSSEVYEFGKQIGAWGQSAVMTDFVNNIESIAISEYLYSLKAPLFMTNNYVHESPEELVAQLEADGINNLLFIGDTGKARLEDLAQISGISTQRISGATVSETCTAISDYLYGSGNFDNIAVSAISSTQWNELLSFGCYSSVTKSALILEEVADLDSACKTLTFIREHAPHTDRLMFIGTENLLDNSNKELLYKSLMLGKNA